MLRKASAASVASVIAAISSVFSSNLVRGGPSASTPGCEHRAHTTASDAGYRRESPAGEADGDAQLLAEARVL